MIGYILQKHILAKCWDKCADPKCCDKCCYTLEQHLTLFLRAPAKVLLFSTQSFEDLFEEFVQGILQKKAHVFDVIQKAAKP